MRDLIYFLLQNPILLLILVAWLLSGLASAAGKARKSAQQRRSTPEFEAYMEKRRRERAEAPHAPPSSAPQTAEDIARQLREMLGLETEAPPQQRPRRVEPAVEADEEERPRHAEPTAGDDELVPGSAGKVGELHEIMEKKRHAATPMTRSVEAHLGHAPTRHGHAPPRHGHAPPRVGHAPTRPAAERHARAAGLRFDGRAAANAFVAMEVLGSPRALRPYDGPS